MGQYAEIERRCALARELGLEVLSNDYGWTNGAKRPGGKTAVVISEVYRPERDGYSGAKVIEEDLLRKWAEDNP